MSSGTLTIAAGETTGALSVTTLQDTLAEADETFTVTITGTTLPGGVTLGTATATGTIEDDETLTASVTAGAATVSENGTASFAVTISGGTSTAGVEVTYTVTGTATSGTDYTAPSGTLTLAAGDASGTITIGTATSGTDYTAPSGTLTLGAGDTSGTIAIAVSADDVLDPGETLVVTLTGASTDAGAAEEDAAAATTTITDTGMETVSVAATTASTVTEGGTAAFTVTLSGKAATETVLGWSTASGAGTGAATSGTDFTAVSSGTLTIAGGETTGTLSVTTLRDTLAEADETFTVTITGATLPSGVELGTATATGTIEDDETLTASVVAGAATVPENGTASFAVALSGGTSTAAVEVTYTVTGTATSGTDYTAPSGTLTLAAGDTSGTITIAVSADDVLDPDETLVVTLTDASTDAGAAEADTTAATTTIADTGTETVSVAATAASTVAEGGTAAFTVTLSGAAATETVLGWSTASGAGTAAAMSGTDFTAVSSGTLTIAAGETTGALSVTTLQDTLAEADETFTVTIAGATLPSGVELGTATATGTIEDDETLTASVTAGAATVSENGTASFAVALTGGTSTAAVEVTYTVTGTATSGTDYTAPSGTLTLGAGDTTGTIAIAVSSDDVLDPGETLIVTLTDASTTAGTAEANAATATTTITDTGTATVSVAATTASTVTEGGTAAFTVTLSGKAATETVLGWSTASGAGTAAATSGTDFTAVSSGTLTIAAGETTGTLSVTTLQDTLAEADETFTVTIAGATLPSGVTLGTATATGTIRDNDTLTASVVAGAATVSENGTASFAVALTGGTSTAAVEVTYTVTGTATSGTDYTAPSGTLTLGAGDASGTITIAVSSDDVLDPGETLVVTLTGVSTDAGAAEEDAATATTTITETGTATVSVAATTASTVAEGGTAAFTVTLSGKAATETVLGWSTASGSGTAAATSGTDFTAVSSGTLTIAAGETSGTLSVTTLQDTLAEADETFTVTITGATLPSGVELGTATATGTIEDDETLTASVTAGAATVSENGTASFAVALSGGTSTAAVEVTYTVTGTATAGTDYTVPSGSLAISAGSTSGTITIQTISDSVLDPGETLIVTLTDATTAGTATVDATAATTTITDDPVSPNLVLSPTSLGVTEGGSASYTVALATAPTGDVTVTVGGTADTDLILDQTSLTFTPDDWSTAQAVSVTAGQDDDLSDDSARLTHDASGGGYGSVSADLPVRVKDDDNASPGLVLSPDSLPLTEGGSGSYTVALATAPTDDVTVTVGGTADTDLILDRTSLTFAPDDWSTAQAVSVTAGQDDDSSDDNARLTHNASGGGYGSVSADLSVTVTDDDAASPGLVLSKSSLSLTEGGRGSYTVALATAPTAEVKVEIENTSDADLSLSKTSLTFDTTNWSTAQAVSVRARQDDDRGTLRHEASGGGYDDETASLRVRVTDDDERGVKVTPTDLQFPESESGTYTVVLESVPDELVTVALTLTGDTDVTVDVPALEFDASSWDTPQTVTVHGAVDVDGENDEATITHTVSGGDYEEETAPDVTVTVTDDHEAGVMISPTALTVEEGGRKTYAVELTMAPTGPVTVTVGGMVGDVSVEESELTFTSENWSTAQAVEVRVAEDDDAEVDNPVTLTHTLTGGGYDDVQADSVTVTCLEDDRVVNAVTLAVDPVEVEEEAGATLLTVTATLTDARATRTTVALTVRDGTATSADYRATAGTLTIERGGRTGQSTLTLTPVNDRDDEPDKTVIVTGQAGDLAVTDAAVTLLDDDEPNRPPAFTSGRYGFDLEENRDGRRTQVALGAVRAVDPDGDPVQYTLTAGDRGRFRLNARNGAVAYVGAGEDFEAGAPHYELTVEARDDRGLAATAAVVVTVLDVNEAPEPVDDEAETWEDTPVVIDVLANDRDPDGDRLQVAAVTAPSYGTAVVAAGGVRYVPVLNYFGPDRFTYTVADPGGLSATAEVRVTVLPVNDAPEAVGVIPEQAVEEGGAPATLDLTSYFTDVDDEVLTYTAVSSDPSVSEVTVASAILTVTAVVKGTVLVTVTARDAEGLTATQVFGVTVGDVWTRMVAENTLAAMGRGHLSSVRMTLGRRVETSGQDGVSRLTVAGRRMSLGAPARAMSGLNGMSGLAENPSGEMGPTDWPLRMMAAEYRAAVYDPAGITARPRLSPGGSGASPPGGAGGAGGVSGLGGMSGLLGAFRGDRDQMLRSTEFLLSVGGGQEDDGVPGREDDGVPARVAAGGGRDWTVWGQGDIQTFRGAPTGADVALQYDGNVRTAYVGVDRKLGERWLAGVAVARTGAAAAWQAGTATGRLTTALTAVHPYLRWSRGATEVWTLLGAGRGAAENLKQVNDTRETSPIGLGLGLVEARRRLATMGAGLQIGLRGEASWARLATGDGEETLDALRASVNRTRIGVEAAQDLTAGGLALSPFGALSARRDGGAGQSGVGLELAGGVRLTGGPVRIEAQGRRLMLHTAAGYEEKGASVTASVGAGPRQRGLSLSLSPRWGAAGRGAEALWQDQVYDHVGGGAGRDGQALDARVGYGLMLTGDSLLTPFGGYGYTGYGKRVQVGAQIGPATALAGGPLQVEFMGERATRKGGAVDYRVTLMGIVNFGGDRIRADQSCGEFPSPCSASPAGADPGGTPVADSVVPAVAAGAEAPWPDR